MQQYRELEIDVSPADTGRHAVIVRSPTRSARVDLNLPFDLREAAGRLSALEIALLRSATTRRRVATAEELTVRQLGSELFDAIFRGETLSILDDSRREAKRDEAGLRIRLRFGSPELAALPWEFLYDPRDGDYLSRSVKTPVVRDLELRHAIEPLKVKPPLRVLGLVASPRGFDALDVGREKHRIEEALAPLRSRLELSWLEDPTWEALLRALQRPGARWHIFHFVGHGGYDRALDEGLVVLNHSSGDAHHLPAGQLATLLGDHDPMRLVVLNSCEGARGGTADIFSSTAASILRKGTPAVVAMQYEISDDAAIRFSQSFYSSVADGLPVDAAVSIARQGIWIQQPASLEWGIPVLHMRARDGLLFEVEHAAAASVSPLPSRPNTQSEPTPTQVPLIQPPPQWTEPTSPVRRARFCTNCGRQIAAGTRFCHGCGKAVSQPRSESARADLA